MTRQDDVSKLQCFWDFHVLSMYMLVLQGAGIMLAEPAHYYMPTEEEWAAIQPTGEETLGFQSAIDDLMHLRSSCNFVSLINDALRNLFTARTYEIGGLQYCVLHER
eukprot:923425-Pelagomonas_calceolata.AAC.1